MEANSAEAQYLKKLIKPKPNIGQYDNEAYTQNPLLRFRLPRVKERRHIERLKRVSFQQKIRLCTRLPPLRPTALQELDENLPSDIYIKQIHFFANKMPIPEMMKTTEIKILSFAPGVLRAKYPDIVSEYMADVKDEYNQIMRAYSIQKIIKPLPGDFVPPWEPFTVKVQGRTENYPTFLKNRDLLQKKLLIVQPFIRCIIDYAQRCFPLVLNDVGVYRVNMGEVILDELENKMRKDLFTNSEFLKNQWYPKIVNVFAKHFRLKKLAEKPNGRRILSCGSTLINREITELKLRTIDAIERVIRDNEQIPYLKLSSIYDGKIDLYPRLTKIFRVYHDMVKDIFAVGSNLRSLEMLLDVPGEKGDFLKIYVSEITMKECHDQIERALLEAYSPLSSYIKDFNLEYQYLASTSTTEQLEKFLAEERTFEEFLERIDLIQIYINKLKCCVQREFFDVALLNQFDAIQSLRDVGEFLIGKIMDQIVSYHIRMSENICSTFIEINRRALEVPTSTEMLLKSAEYMTHVKENLLQELLAKVEEYVRIGGILIEFKELSIDHLQQQIKTINWFNNIQEVFGKNAVLQEMYKGQFEEHLQNVTKKLNEDINKLLPDLSMIDNMCEKFSEYFGILHNLMEQLTVFDNYVDWINKEEKLYKFPKSTYPILEEIKQFIIPFAGLIHTCMKWQRYFNIWMDGPFEYLDPVTVTSTVDKYHETFEEKQKYYRNRIKADLIGNPICKFRGQTEDPDPEKHPAPLKLCCKMLHSISEFRLGVQIVRIMCIPALRERHWKEMSDIVGYDLTPNAGTTLRKIIQFDLEEKLPAFELISIAANKELLLHEGLQKMKSDWNGVEFSLGKCRQGSFEMDSIVDVESIVELVDSQLTSSIAMRGSTFVKPCKEEATEWADKLQRINETVQMIGEIQKNMLMLLPIFSIRSIYAELPADFDVYEVVKEQFSGFVQEMETNSNVIKMAPRKGFLETLQIIAAKLETILGHVNRYLDSKRLQFGRFFLISSQELFEVIADSENIKRTPKNFYKIFEGVSELIFNADDGSIKGFKSGNDECLLFTKAVSLAPIDGQVVPIYQELNNEMTKTVRMQLKQSKNKSFTLEALDWMAKYPQMIILTRLHVLFVNQVEAHLNGNLVEVKSAYERTLSQFVVAIRDRRNKWTSRQRLLIKTIISFYDEKLNILDVLLSNNVHTENDFSWLSQLRFYEKREGVWVDIIMSTINFGFEYIGNGERIFITPLTNRCFRTIFSAFQFHHFSSMSGPAGTGKTETVRELCRAAAINCKTFNCSMQLTIDMLNGFFKGIILSGSWLCLDDFNRVTVETMSVVAQTMADLMKAKQANLEFFSELRLHSSCYICMTLNPKYIARQDLPNSVRILFRNVAMINPDLAIISKIFLDATGFKDSESHTKRIMNFLELCSQKLSQQLHYDFKLRDLKTILSTCETYLASFDNEVDVIQQSLRDVLEPKIFIHDLSLYKGIEKDIFPEEGAVLRLCSDRRTRIKEYCEQNNYHLNDFYMSKLMQTMDLLEYRHGVIMIGQPLSGKSSIWRIIKDVFEEEVIIEAINPKCFSIDELFGSMSKEAIDVSDGLISKILRRFQDVPEDVRKWLIIDGPIDSLWIENMNSLLDENRKLCLRSGEIIRICQKTSIFFEVQDLRYATPATMSRCGIINMEASSIGWRAFVCKWCQDNSAVWSTNQEDLILELFDWIVPHLLDYIVPRTHQMYLYPGKMNLIRSMWNLFEMLLDDAILESPDDYAKNLTTWFQAALIVASFWGLGGVFDQETRTTFDAYFRQYWRSDDDNTPLPDLIGKLEVSLPTEGIMYDYNYVFKQKGSWRYCPELMRRMDPEMTVHGLQIPTVDAARYYNLIELHIRHNRPFLMVGPSGSGKSFYIHNYLKTKATDHHVANVSYTVLSKASTSMKLILSKLTKQRRHLYGSSADGPKSVVYVDDVNMPRKDEFQVQSSVELLRQFMDYGYWHDSQSFNKVRVANTFIVAACGLVGGGRQELCPRFLSHFNLIASNAFTNDTLHRIYNMVLLTGLKNRGHSSDVATVVTQIVNATINVYRSAIDRLKPTPQKCQYQFSIHDLGRVFNGCMCLRRESNDIKKLFPRVWVHETLRVFYDRLVDADDRKWLLELIDGTVETDFGTSLLNVFEDWKENEESEKIELHRLSSLLFAFSMEKDGPAEDRRYEEIHDLNQFKEAALKAIDEFNSSHKSQIDVVLFGFALEHISKLCRILNMPGGNCILVGTPGSGRESLAKIATAMCKQTLLQNDLLNLHDFKSWRKTVKESLREAGGKGHETAFLLNEIELKKEEYLQDIDSLLVLSEIANVFSIEEEYDILEMVRIVAQCGNKNVDVSSQKVYDFFISRCREKLHLILCFSPMGETFREKVHLYPSLLKHCSVHWFDSWPKEALEMISEKYMLQMDLPEEVKYPVKFACQYFHNQSILLSQRYYQETRKTIYITPASFLELNKTYRALIKKKQRETMAAKERYHAGLETLEYASNTVAIMQRELNDLQPKLITMAENSLEMMRKIQRKTAEAKEATELVKIDELNANAQAAVAQELKDECEKDLAQAIPVLEEAIQALNTLKPADITLVKSMKNPPETVKLVMAAVCVIKGVAPDRINDPATGKKIIDYWGPSKRVLGDMGFLQSLKDFDKDNILPDIMRKVRKDFIPHKDFKPPIVAKASSAAEGLCKWIIAMDLYDSVAKVVAPKKARLEAAEKEYADTMKVLNEKRQLAEELARKVASLNEELREANRQKQSVEAEVERTSLKLQRAESLISSLGGEKQRWTDAAENLQTIFDHLAGDILVSAAVIAYLGPFSFEHRKETYLSWHRFILNLNIPCSPHFQFVDILGTEINVQGWTLAGLPRDIFSAENALIMENSSRHSLLIDPQSQANTWIKNLERENKIRTTKFIHKNFMAVLEECMMTGKPCLIEHIDSDLELSIDPILFKNTFEQGGAKYIDLGSKVIPYNDKFRLYLISNKRNPDLSPAVYSKVTVINFALASQGLEEQLLGIVVAKERPDLQELRLKVIFESAQNKKTLKALEDNILKTLSNSQGDILDDKNAIQILDDSKVLSQQLKVKQIEAVETEKTIDSFRYNYRPVACHSTVLYYTVIDLSNINPLYQYSLQWYTNLFVQSIESANKSKDLNRRLKFLMDAITINLYNNVCRSIFEKDKVLFSFLLTCKIMISCNQLHQRLFIYFLKGNVKEQITEGEDGEETGHSPLEWLPRDMWSRVIELDEIPEFKGISEDIVRNEREWRVFFTSMETDKIQPPYPWFGKTNRFEKLVLIKILRPDRLSQSVKAFVDVELGSLYVHPPDFELSKSFEEANCLTPLIFFLGADPMQALIGFAKKLGFDKVLKTISLGKENGQAAVEAIVKAQKFGNWVCLQNCHLVPEWLPTLETIWEKTSTKNTSPTYRLWLTTETSPHFPISLLQNGIKITKEPPQGLKENLLRLYKSEPISNPKFYSGCPAKYREFTKLLYGFCFFHSVIQVRKQFGAFGWNVDYDFDESDFFVSVSQLQRLINKTGVVDFAGISILTEANYGGKIDNAWEHLKLMTILKDYFNDKVISDPGYEFYPTEEHVFGIPRKFEHRDMVKHIEEMIPSAPDSTIYDVHPNAQIRRGVEDGKWLLADLVLTLGRIEEPVTDEKEQQLYERVAVLKGHLEAPFDLVLVKEKFPNDYKQCLNMNLLQECIVYNLLLARISKALGDLQDAIDGKMIYTHELREIAQHISKEEVPIEWQRVSYPTMKPIASYLVDLRERVQWVKQWIDTGTPDSFWLAAFFYPQSFLISGKQNYARQKKLVLSDIRYEHRIGSYDGCQEISVFVYGVFIEGARWDLETGRLTEQRDKEIRNTVPGIHFIPTVMHDKDVCRKTYRAPVYKTERRSDHPVYNTFSGNYVTAIDLETDLEPVVWIKRGVALILQSSE